MKVLPWEDLASWRKDGAPIAAAIGVFDGLHVGHRALIRRVLGRPGLASAVVTFAENPKRVLSPSSFRGELSTLAQRLDLIASMGVDLCVLIDFSGDFSKLPGRLFLSALRDGGELRFLAVGSNFRCGHRLDTDAEGIREFCEQRSIDAEFLDAVQWSGYPVSSSRIRKAVLEGRLGDAEAMLDRPYEIDLRGAIPLGDGAWLPSGGQASPPAGSYEAVASFAGGEGEPGSQARRSLPVAATHGKGGSWALAAGGPEGAPGIPSDVPTGLSLLRMVSRV
jgi:riboflavin kinase / FMN adenylyltransferase